MAYVNSGKCVHKLPVASMNDSARDVDQGCKQKILPAMGNVIQKVTFWYARYTSSKLNPTVIAFLRLHSEKELGNYAPRILSSALIIAGAPMC